MKLVIIIAIAFVALFALIPTASLAFGESIVDNQPEKTGDDVHHRHDSQDLWSQDCREDDGEGEARCLKYCATDGVPTGGHKGGPTFGQSWIVFSHQQVAFRWAAPGLSFCSRGAVPAPDKPQGPKRDDGVDQRLPVIGVEWLYAHALKPGPDRRPPAPHTALVLHAVHEVSSNVVVQLLRRHRQLGSVELLFGNPSALVGTDNSRASKFVALLTVRPKQRAIANDINKSWHAFRQTKHGALCACIEYLTKRAGDLEAMFDVLIRFLR